MTTQTAYRCTDPAVTHAFQQWKDDYETHRRRVIDEAEQLGNNTGVMGTQSIFGLRIVGLATDDPDTPPAGWKYSKAKGYLRPDRRTKAGKEADAWLKKAQPPSHLTFLHDHGMPTDNIRATGQIYMPGAEVVDGDLLVFWGCDVPAEKVTGPWERIPLSRYYAAIEKAEANA